MAPLFFEFQCIDAGIVLMLNLSGRIHSILFATPSKKDPVSKNCRAEQGKKLSGRRAKRSEFYRFLFGFFVSRSEYFGNSENDRKVKRKGFAVYGKKAFSFFAGLVFLVLTVWAIGSSAESCVWAQENDLPGIGNFPQLPPPSQLASGSTGPASGFSFPSLPSPTEIAMTAGGTSSQTGSNASGEPSLPKLPSTSAPPPPPSLGNTSIPSPPSASQNSNSLNQGGASASKPAPKKVNPVASAPSALAMPSASAGNGASSSSDRSNPLSNNPPLARSNPLSNNPPLAGSNPLSNNSPGSNSSSGVSSSVRNAPVPPGSIPAIKSAVPSGSSVNQVPDLRSNTTVSPALKNGSRSAVSNAPANNKNRTAPAVKNPVRTELVPIPESNVFSAFLKMPDPVRSDIIGKKMTLADFIKNTGNAYARSQRVQDWWSLTEKFAIYNVCLTRLQDVQLCMDRSANRNDPFSVSNQQAAVNEMKIAELAFTEAQFSLCARYPELYSSLRGTFQMNAKDRKEALKSVLPVPSDVPSVSEYNTRKEEIAKNRPLSFRARYLAQTIPLQFQSVCARIEGSNQAYAGLKALFQKPNVSNEVLFTALDRATEAKIEMVRAIIEYNKMMAEYSAETVSANVRGIRFFATINQRYQEAEVRTSGVRSVGYDTTLYRQSADQSERTIKVPAPLKMTDTSIRPMSGMIEKTSSYSDSKTKISPPAALSTETKISKAEIAPVRPSPLKTVSEVNSEKRIIELPPTLPEHKIIEKPDDSSSESDKFFKKTPEKQGSSNGLDPKDRIRRSPELLENGDSGSMIIRGQMPRFETFQNERVALNQTPVKGSLPASSVVEPESNDVSVPEELQTRMRDILTVLYKIDVGRSGAGDSPIVEMPLSLRQAIGNNQNVQERLAIVDAYWRLKTKLAELEIEKKVHQNLNEILKDLPNKLRTSQGTPDLAALIGTWQSELLRSEAKINELKIEVRQGQIRLLERMGRSTDNGWPIPSTIPYWGPNYRLETAGARTDSFVLLTELVLVPEKMKTVRETGNALGSPDFLLRPENGSFVKIDDGWRYLKLMENKRKNAVCFIGLLESLNGSIARYVSFYSRNPVPNDVFIQSLIGSSH